MTLWNKTSDSEPNAAMQSFLCGDDLHWDNLLLPWDIRGTRAQIAVLADLRMLSDGDVESLNEQLDRLLGLHASGEYELGAPFEDSHSAIEAWLTEHCGDAGARIHTGRSRNDQVQTVMRLYMVDKLADLRDVCARIHEVTLTRARQSVEVLMPGYTHLQRAVPSTLGLWFASWAESYADIAQLCDMTRRWLSASPLGSAAGYGVNLALNRQLAAETLGLDRVQINPAYCQNSRGRFELQVLAVLAQATMELRRLSWDLSLFSSAEFAFVRMPESMTTGSSIMPNKRNPDLVELLRASHAVVAGATTEIQSVLGLSGGYHRDLQGTKGPFMRAVEHGLAALSLVPDLLAGIEFDESRMADAIDADMLKTDLAIDAAVSGQTFREAYHAIKAGEVEPADPATSIAARVSPGGCANLQLDQIAARLPTDHS